MLNCVVLLNWNGWRDTIECLASVFHLDIEDFCVVICDNASSDGSLEHIKAWARGEILPDTPNPQLSRLGLPPVGKPIPYQELTREQVKYGAVTSDARLVLIQNGANLGFAGGNNVGLRYALGDSACQFFWLLNNDTVVEPGALSALVSFMRQHPEVGLCGSLNLSYYNPGEVQAYGGKTYNRWSARVPNLSPDRPEKLTSPGSRMDFVNGASMLVSRQFLEKIGLMEESYFLYFEELDWAMRGRGKFSLGFAHQSIVYHKEGASIGSSVDRTKRSLLSESYLSRNRVLFTKQFFPWALPTVLICVFLAAVQRLLRGDLKRAKIMLASMWQGLRADVSSRSSGLSA